jgi:hypothetical protein
LRVDQDELNKNDEDQGELAECQDELKGETRDAKAAEGELKEAITGTLEGQLVRAMGSSKSRVQGLLMSHGWRNESWERYDTM